MAGTLADMKSRIADEISRSDLSNEIGRAISDAIDTYQSTRFFFNESRDVTFNTTVAQEFYDASDEPNISDLLSVDYVKIKIGSVLWGLMRKEPQDLELAIPANGQPSSWTYYNQQLRLYPIPFDVWEVRIAGQILTAEPTTDTEKNNPWMTYGERLVRSCAKRLLFLNVDDLDANLAVAQTALEKEAVSELKGRTAKMLGMGRVKSY